jgi:hypothetical protein
MTELDEFRADKDAFFRGDPRSPLPPERRASFEGLTYFPADDALVIRGPLETEGVDREERIVMQTTTGGEQAYRRAGIVRFEVEGEPARLTLFASDDAHDLFLPFRDATSGKETYGAGRYLEVDPPGLRRRRRRRPEPRVQPVLRLQPRVVVPDPARRELARGPDPGRRAIVRGLHTVMTILPRA